MIYQYSYKNHLVRINSIYKLLFRKKNKFSQCLAQNHLFNNPFNTDSKSTRILVVGAGPVGMSLALLLKKNHNIQSILVEKQIKQTQHPQAHFVNTRSMELFYSCLPEVHEQLLQESPPIEEWTDFIYCYSAFGDQFARINHFDEENGNGYDKVINQLGQITPTRPVHIAQSKVERILSEYCEKCQIDKRMGIEVIDVKKSLSGSLNVEFFNRNGNRRYHENFDFVVGCDGAHSLIRKKMKVKMIGQRNLQQLINIHFTSKELSKKLRTKSAMLYFVFNPDVIGVLICHDLQEGNFVLQMPYFPPLEKFSSFTTEKCASLLTQAVGCPLPDLTIQSIGQWELRCQVAERFQCKDNRLFLAGDSSHVFPPAGGLGMNTGLMDAQEIAWRLGTTLNQQHKESSLLEGYDQSRRRTVLQTSALSLENLERTLRVSRALDLPPPDIANTAAEICQVTHSNHFVETAFRYTKSKLAQLKTSRYLRGFQLRQRVKHLVENRKALGLLFVDFELYPSEEWKNTMEMKVDEMVKKVKRQQRTFQLGQRLGHFLCQQRGESFSSLQLPLKLSKRHEMVPHCDAHPLPFVVLLTKTDQFHKEWAKRVLQLNLPGHAILQKVVSHESECLDEDCVVSEIGESVYDAIVIDPSGHIEAVWVNNSNEGEWKVNKGKRF